MPKDGPGHFKTRPVTESRRENSRFEKCYLLTPSLPQPVHFRHERWKDAPANSVFSGPITLLLSMTCVFMKILSHGSRKRKKGLMVSNFSLLIVVFK